jgi:hypothetical protein
MGLLARVFMSSGPTHGRAPYSLLSESKRRGTHSTKPRQCPLSLTTYDTLDTTRQGLH